MPGLQLLVRDMSVENNALACTNDMIDAIESMVQNDPSLAVVYGNSALAAVILIFNKYHVDINMNRELFRDIWMPITGSQARLEG